jgi:hypothetical protein
MSKKTRGLSGEEASASETTGLQSETIRIVRVQSKLITGRKVNQLRVVRVKVHNWTSDNLLR